MTQINKEKIWLALFMANDVIIPDLLCQRLTHEDLPTLGPTLPYPDHAFTSDPGQQETYLNVHGHYALLDAVKAKGGPTHHTKASVPDWDGYYSPSNVQGRSWMQGNSQITTVLSLLTPEYRKRMVQQIYHEGVTNSPQWNASFCYPEGLVRWWVEVSRGGNIQMVVTPWMVQTVSGIGPRIALALLSTLTPDDLRRAVAAGDEAALTRVSGIGRKGAQFLARTKRDMIAEFTVTDRASFAEVKPVVVVVPAPVVQVPVDPVAAFMASLSEIQHCPCCQQHKNKAEFGVRVMKRDVNGVPVSIRRQSYCRTCR